MQRIYRRMVLWIVACFVLLCSNQAQAELRQTDAEFARMLDGPVEELQQLYEAAEGKERKQLEILYAVSLASKSSSEEARALLAKFPDQETTRTELGEEWYWLRIAFEGSLVGRSGDLGHGENLCGRAIAHVDQMRFHVFKAVAFGCGTFISARLGDLQQALSFAGEAVAYAEAGGSFDQFTGALSNEALVLYLTRLYEPAIERYERLLSFSERLDLGVRRIVRFNLGLVLLDIGHHEKALSEFQEAIRWSEQSGQRARTLIAHTYNGKALNALSRHSETIASLAPILAEDLNGFDEDTVANARVTLATAYLAIGDADQALVQADLGLEISNSLRRSELSLSRARALSDSGNIEEAFRYLNQVVEENRQNNDPNLSSSLANLADLAEQLEDHQLAFLALKESTELHRIEQDAELTRRITALDSMYDLAQARETLKLVEANAARDIAVADRRFLLLLIFSASSLFIGTLVLLVWGRARQKRELSQQKETSEKLEVLVAERTRDLEARVTEIMQQRSELVELQKQLDEAEKLRAIGTLTGGIAHDFNNLLSVIMGSASMLEQIPDLEPERQEKLVQAILNAGEAGARITNSLLAYARRQPLNPEAISVDACLKSSSVLFEKALGVDHQLQIDIQSGASLVDQGALVTAVMNLVINARDASPSGGIVTISGRSIHADGQYAIEVIDAGTGMTHEQSERAIEPFFSTKSASRSTGLGLSMVHGFAHQSGGEIEIETAPGEGTTIRLLLPLSESGEAAELTDQNLARQTNLKVLCVDDNPDVLEVIIAMLKMDNHKVTATTSATEALNVLREGGDWDVLVSDIVMPGAMSGLQLAQEAQKFHPNQKVILVSGYSEEIETHYPLLTKPFSQAELQKAIDGLFVDFSG